MNTFAVEIWYDEGSVCTFYTVRYNDEGSETDKFFDKYTASNHQFEEKARQLFYLIIESIGNKYGATDDFFDRSENKAQALPPKPKRKVEEIKEIGAHFPLRLYCYRVTEQIVILFNGGVKDSDSAQGSKNLSMKFYEAQTFAGKIEEAFRSEMIFVTSDNRYIKKFDGTTEIIL